MTAIAERFVSIIANPDNQYLLVNSELGQYYMGRYSDMLMSLDKAEYHAARMVARRIDEALSVVTSPDPDTFISALDTACETCNAPCLGIDANVQHGGERPRDERVIVTWHYNYYLGEWACLTF